MNRETGALWGDDDLGMERMSTVLMMGVPPPPRFGHCCWIGGVAGRWVGIEFPKGRRNQGDDGEQRRCGDTVPRDIKHYRYVFANPIPQRRTTPEDSHPPFKRRVVVTGGGADGWSSPELLLLLLLGTVFGASKWRVDFRLPLEDLYLSARPNNNHINCLFCDATDSLLSIRDMFIGVCILSGASGSLSRILFEWTK